MDVHHATTWNQWAGLQVLQLSCILKRGHKWFHHRCTNSKVHYFESTLSGLTHKKCQISFNHVSYFQVSLKWKLIRFVLSSQYAHFVTNLCWHRNHNMLTLYVLDVMEFSITVTLRTVSCEDEERILSTFKRRLWGDGSSNNVVKRNIRLILPLVTDHKFQKLHR